MSKTTAQLEGLIMQTQGYARWNGKGLQLNIHLTFDRTEWTAGIYKYSEDKCVDASNLYVNQCSRLERVEHELWQGELPLTAGVRPEVQIHANMFPGNLCNGHGTSNDHGIGTTEANVHTGNGIGTAGNDTSGNHNGTGITERQAGKCIGTAGNDASGTDTDIGTTEAPVDVDNGIGIAGNDTLSNDNGIGIAEDHAGNGKGTAGNDTSGNDTGIGITAVHVDNGIGIAGHDTLGRGNGIGIDAAHGNDTDGTGTCGNDIGTGHVEHQGHSVERDEAEDDEADDDQTDSLSLERALAILTIPSSHAGPNDSQTMKLTLAPWRPLEQPPTARHRAPMALQSKCGEHFRSQRKSELHFILEVTCTPPRGLRRELRHLPLGCCLYLSP